VLDEGRDEMLARLLAVADNIDTSLSLIIQGQSQRILLARDQLLTFQFPW
jgi:hypothetical protein